jgi:hypothetical protein
MEREYIIRVLRNTGGVISTTAIRLGVPRTTLNAIDAEAGDHAQGCLGMWIRNPTLLFAGALILLAQSNDLLVKSQSYSTVPEVRQIVAALIAAIERSWQRRLQYTCVERDEDRRLDSEGRVKSEEVDVSRMILVSGVPFEQLVERNGQPPPVATERKQTEQLERLERDT